MKRLAVATLLLVVVAAVAYGVWYVWVIAPAKARVSMGFKDPFSVEFEDVRYSGAGGGAVCGRVNAKNSTGAYIGFRRFVYVTDTNKAFVELGPANAEQGDADSETRRTISETAKAMLEKHCGGS